MTTIRPSLGTVCISVVIGLVICLPGIDAIRLGQWQGLVFLMIGLTIAVVPSSRYRISWDADVLVYRGLIETRKIRFTEISQFDVRGPVQGDRFGPTLGIRIFSGTSKMPQMTINIKPFARRDIARLNEHLKQAVKADV